MKLLIATKNPGKFREMRQFLGAQFEVVALPSDAPDVAETGTTFLENATLKAVAYFNLFGIPAVSDDGGLEIGALHGEPGVFSRRWPGHEATDQELIDLALAKLRGVPWTRRDARLRTVGAYHDGVRTLTAAASIDGHIVERQTAACEPGYPFRSIFWVDRFVKLYTELSPEEHELVNHRRVVYAELAQRIA